MRSQHLASFLILCLFGNPEESAAASKRVEQVSIINLIASPIRFGGKTVGVYGFLALGEEQSAIYLTAADAEIGNDKNAVWVEFLPEVGKVDDLSGHYVFVVGEFDPSDKGHLSAYSGTIKNVSKVRLKK